MAVPKLKLNSGYDIPQIGLGTLQSEKGEAGEAVKMAFEIGYGHIDCAMLYGNQEEIGGAFDNIFSSGKVKREDAFVTSKIWNTFHSYEKTKLAIDSMLKDLQISYLDLCLIHFPVAYAEDKDGLFPKDDQGKLIHTDTDYLDTWKAMENAVDAGKIRSIGLSNFNSKQVKRVMDNCRIKPTVLQVEMHPYFSQIALLDWCKKNDIIVTAYSPLANNTSVFRTKDHPNLLTDNVIVAIAKKHKKTPAQVAIRWAIQRGTVVIPKSTKRHRLEENFDVFHFQLTQGDMEAIDGLDRKLRLATLDHDSSHPYYPFHEM